MVIRRRTPHAAGLISLLLPGFGQIYNGQLRKGLTFFVVALFIGPLSLVLLVLLLPGEMYLVSFSVTILVVLAFRIGIIADAFRTAKGFDGPIELKLYNSFTLSGVFLILGALATDLSAGRIARNYVAKTYRILSGTMSDTLLIGDYVVVDKLAYGIRDPLTGKCVARCESPARNDVIVFLFPEDRSKDMVKRVIALPGETIAIRNKKILINGKEIDDPHAFFSDKDQFSATPSKSDNLTPQQLPTDCFFVLGDDRDRSYDSRFWGCVRLNDVKGKARLIYWSWQSGIRWRRIGQLVL
jgi:signal peptidase I